MNTRKIIVIVLLVVFAVLVTGCETSTIVVTATPGVLPDPTPTQEIWTSPTPGFNLCNDLTVGDEFLPISANPCLGQPYIDMNGFLVPAQLTVDYHESEISESFNTPQTIAIDDGIRVDITGFAGRFGYMAGVYNLRPGQCHIIKFVFDSSLAYQDYYQAITNFSAYVRVYRDNGTWQDLPDHEFNLHKEGNELVWGLWTLEDNGLSIAVGIEAMYALGLHGSYIDFKEFGIYTTTDNGYCSMPPV